MTKPMQIPSSARELTGRAVLLWLLGFFAVTAGVNAVMIHFASKTFGGVETASSYKAGLAFKQDIAAAEQQDALHWKVEGTLNREPTGETALEIRVRDGAGRTVSGWTATALLSHPMDSRLDQHVDMVRNGPETARGHANAAPGHWNISIEIEREGLRLFRSRSRIVIR